jgi:hypothetical protein
MKNNSFPANDLMNIKKIIELALKDFDKFLKNSDWYGRENEVVNIFAHKFLVAYLAEPPLISLDQIGIEVAVKQLKSENAKDLVRKDLVIWKSGVSSVWNGNREVSNSPLAIVEWKVNKISKCSYDIEWLQKYTKLHPETLGYSVSANIKENRGAKYTRIEKGSIS